MGTWPRCALLVLAILLSSCNNILTPFGDKTSDKAILFDAKNKIDNSQWDAAIEALALLSTSAQSQRDVLDLKASAYAGRCGLNYLRLISDLSGIGSTKFLLFLMQKNIGATTSQIADCAQAEAIIRSISTDPTARTLDENLFLVFSSFVKIGRVLAARADTLGATTPDPSFDACSTSSLSDADAAQVASGLGNALITLTAVAAQTAIGSSEFTSINTVCSALAAVAPAYNFCTLEDPSTITASQLKGVRSIIQENQFVGIGSCSGNLATCLCL